MILSRKFFCWTRIYIILRKCTIIHMLSGTSVLRMSTLRLWDWKQWVSIHLALVLLLLPNKCDNQVMLLPPTDKCDNWVMLLPNKCDNQVWSSSVSHSSVSCLESWHKSMHCLDFWIYKMNYVTIPETDVIKRLQVLWNVLFSIHNTMHKDHQ